MKSIACTCIVHSIHIKLCGLLVRFGWIMVEFMRIFVSHEIESAWKSFVPSNDYKVNVVLLTTTVGLGIDDKHTGMF